MCSWYAYTHIDGFCIPTWTRASDVRAELTECGYAYHDTGASHASYHPPQDTLRRLDDPELILIPQGLACFCLYTHRRFRYYVQEFVTFRRLAAFL